MESEQAFKLTKPAQVTYAAGSAAFTMLERLILLYVPFYFLPPREYGLPNLISEETFLGLGTMLGAALALGRIVDAAADPVVATLSDNLRLRQGRRKPFLLWSSLPLSAFTVLIFYPPFLSQEHLLNGIWLALMMSLFYLGFTAYVNPYLSLLSELGHTDAIRINLSTLVALFGMLGMILITVFFPEIVSRLQDAGMELRASYRLAVGGAAIPSLILLCLAGLSFNEAKHCKPVTSERQGLWKSLGQTLKVRPFRRFVFGEIFMQFALNLVTMGMIYYAVVIFRQDQRFMAVLAAVVLSSALLAFPLINNAAKRKGKIKILVLSSLVLAFCTMIIFLFSFNMTGVFFYLGIAVIALAGIPTAAFSILVNPIIAEIARSEAAKTGDRREAIFFGARAVPLKITIALAGGVFGFLLSTFGRDIADPLGVQLTLLLISLASLAAYFVFRGYPEKEVQEALQEEEKSF